MEYKFPSRVNKSLIIAFFTIEQFIPMFICMALGYTFSVPIESILLAVIYFKLSSYFINNYPRGYVEHMLWYGGFIKLNLGKSTPDPMKKEFIQ